jgi:hypothetical protein
MDALLQPFRAWEARLAVSVSREWTPFYSDPVRKVHALSVSVSREWTPFYS